MQRRTVQQQKKYSGSVNSANAVALLHNVIACCQRCDRLDYKLVVLVYKCLHGLAPSYLVDELHYPAESELRSRLRSASSHELRVIEQDRILRNIKSFKSYY